jgi:hypothetical protein
MEQLDLVRIKNEREARIKDEDEDEELQSKTGESTGVCVTGAHQRKCHTHQQKCRRASLGSRPLRDRSVWVSSETITRVGVSGGMVFTTTMEFCRYGKSAL